MQTLPAGVPTHVMAIGASDPDHHVCPQQTVTKFACMTSVYINHLVCGFRKLTSFLVLI